MFAGFYQIKEGYVGLIKEFGVLKKDLKEPGFHFLIPGYQ
jgi:regulator of protease activity HflC (stomatin/prohibitin superfamily)